LGFLEEGKTLKYNLKVVSIIGEWFIDGSAHVRDVHPNRAGTESSRVGKRSARVTECRVVSPETFQLLISDMTMPEMMGVRLINEIKAMRPDIPAIICTGYSSQIDMEGAKEMGIEHFVMKPISSEVLSCAVQNALSSRNGK
jgi:DNA-binding NtrC family response regulator